MAKQQKRMTRRQKIEASRLTAIEEKKQLRSAVASLEKRVDRLEKPKIVAEGRPVRNFIGKETE